MISEDGRGLFISFEGVEGSGKSTQIKKTVEWLEQKGHEVYVTREPGGCPLAERLRGLLLDISDDPPIGRAEVFILQAARAQHVDTVILPKLKAGITVVCDRFYDSTIAYQAFARGLDIDTVKSCIEFAVAGVHPDITIILDLPPEDGLARQANRNRMEEECLEFHKAVRAGFKHQAETEPARVKLVDAKGSVEEVHARIVAELSGVVQK